MLGLDTSPVNGASWYKVRMSSSPSNEGYVDTEFVAENCPTGVAPTSAPPPAKPKEERQQAADGAVRIRFAKDGESAVLVRIVKDAANAVHVRTAKNGESAVAVRISRDGAGAVNIWFVDGP